MKGDDLFNVTLESETIPTKTYSVEYKCDNCGREKYFYIPNGIPVREHLKDIICDWCKCKIVKEKEQIQFY